MTVHVSWDRKLTHVEIKRGPDKGAVALITRRSPFVLREGGPTYRYMVECTHHEHYCAHAKTKAEAIREARAIGSWCWDCRTERHEERDPEEWDE